jgi:hypothetical protein
MEKWNLMSHALAVGQNKTTGQTNMKQEQEFQISI